MPRQGEVVLIPVPFTDLSSATRFGNCGLISSSKLDRPDGLMRPVMRNFCRRTRREFLWEAGAAFTGVALAALWDQDGFFAARAAASEPAPLQAPRQPHFAA